MRDPMSSDFGPTSVVYDRRSSYRVDFSSPVLLDNQQAWWRCTAENISEGGLCLADLGPLEAGAKVELYFELPNGTMIEAQAEVVRCFGSVVSVRFLQLNDDQLRGLRSFVSLRRQLEIEIQYAS
jgi:hypothetical protein